MHICLTSALRIPPSQIILDAKTFSVQVGAEKKDHYDGLLPLVHVLRNVATTDQAQLFLGNHNTVCASLINQWVAMGWCIEMEVLNISERGKPLEGLKRLFQRLEEMLLLQQKSCSTVAGMNFPFLVPQKWEGPIFSICVPTLADHLLYAALQDCGPLYVQLAQPVTQKWFLDFQTQQLSRLIDALPQEESISHAFGSSTSSSSGVPAATERGAGVEKSGGASTTTPSVKRGSGDDEKNTNPHCPAAAVLGNKKNAKPVYVKPTEEDIARRRLEKEKAKREKETQKIAKAASANNTTNTDKTATTSSALAPPQASEKGKDSSTAWIHQSLDIRVGRFTHVRRHPTADRLYVEDMELGVVGGERVVRTIVSGLVDHYPDVETLENTLCLVVCNMKPKPLKGVKSEGMVLCAHGEGKLGLIRPPLGSKPGDRVVFRADGAYTLSAAEQEALTGDAPFLLRPPAARMTEALASLHTNPEGALCGVGQQGWLPHGIVSIPDMPSCPVK